MTLRSGFWRKELSAMLFGGAATLALGAAMAQAALPPIGSANVATADPDIPALPTTPCLVPLFNAFTFADYSGHPFTFTPPVNCPAPWGKVVLSADFDVTAGRQFDRTAAIWLGGANIYFGTTQEPRTTVAPSWHVERDLTDYSPLFLAAQTGHADLGNTVNGTYTGIIHGSASLLFYPPPANLPDHPRRPDALFPLAAHADGGTADLANSDARLSLTFTKLPTNIERAFLDVIAQSQASDEFWYLCVPDSLAASLQSCPGSAFRESEISIDGVPAGIAPVYPWIYTGGIDPYLWRPIPGIQTLSFQPYRVDLTPFVGVLSDGNPHTIAVGVFNAQDHFSTTANLLLYLDHASMQVTGSVLTNTLTAPVSTITTDTQNMPGGVAHTTLNVSSGHDFVIEGYVQTSHGRVDTKIQQVITFENDQSFNIDANGYEQYLTQDTTVDSTTTIGAGRYAQVLHEKTSYVLHPVSYSYTMLADGSAKQDTHVAQELHRSIDVGTAGYAARHAQLDQYASGDNTLNFDAAGNFTGNTGQFGHNLYYYKDGFGACYERSITAESGVLATVIDGDQCANHTNALSWFDAFRNYASMLTGATVQILQ